MNLYILYARTFEEAGIFMEEYNFSDLMDTGAIQLLTDSLSRALQVNISIRSPQGERVAQDSCYCTLYRDIILKTAEAEPLYNRFAADLCAHAAPSPYICQSQPLGLTDAVIGIQKDGIIVACMIVGGVRLAERLLKESEYLNMADSLLIERKAYLDAIQSTPLMTAAHFDDILNLLALLAVKFTQLGHRNLYLRSVISSLENQESLRQQERDDLEKLIEKDSMTGLYNRRKFEEIVLQYSHQKWRKICMISADANFLKLTNDIFGHEAGDQLLQNIAKIMQDLAKKTWLVARCGGDEFRVILPDTTLETALDYCRRVARNCRKDKTLTLPLSVALGAAEWNSEAEGLQDCFSRADVKMYQNKTALKHELRIPDYIMERLYDRQILNKEVVEFTSRLTLEFALYLGINKDHAKEISLAAHYQDIGMAKLPESFVIRGQSRTEEETSQIHTHVTHSYTMGRQFDELYKSADIMHSTHENWSGGGYPNGLTGAQIPIEARIIHITTDYASWTHPTVTGGFRSREDTKKKLTDDSGSVYDPNLISKFLKFLNEQEY